ncbi:PAS and ANTAR domain-containing protein [Mycolicibacterium pyrenivorans]|uniref:PAS and ANTAR domain-containing protein n=1 Tax=Mycolicibacterium pyrenivorans TaxID=187102 RepID=UPI0021F3366F|nr:PAS and ANTAR domain-containing protein [Mycolicibacterium pyrenivorans]MCV7151875.1 ANTAR domain-containing protein [Mycolicibacterium pyrenivorans]
MDAESIEQAALGVDDGAPLAGWFNFHFEDERWEWSPEVARIHGYAPAECVTPTTDLVMRHKHPDDRPKMAAMLELVRRTRQAISTRHRIIDATGATRDVIVLGEHLHDETGAEVGIHGFYIDVTPIGQDGPTPERDYQRDISAAVSEIAESRGPIERVKGMLMLAYRIDEHRAFQLLRWRSQETNVKLRALAIQLAVDLVALEYDETLPSRSSVDRLLLTAHLRVGGSSAVAS